MAAKDVPDNEQALVVLGSFVGSIGGADRAFAEGENIRPDDPAVRKWPHMFGPARFPHDKAEQPKPLKVEQATAAPGELRGAPITTSSLSGDVKAATAAPGEKRA